MLVKAAEAECRGPKYQVWNPATPIRAFMDDPTVRAPRKQMDPPGLGEANHVGLDALQDRKIKVLGSEKTERDKPVLHLSWRNPNPISRRQTYKEPWENL